jgi:hypothetical protein
MALRVKRYFMNRTDKEIRTCLIPYLTTMFGDGFITEEFCLRKVRTDLVVGLPSSGDLHGFEIKSGADSLTRLKTQIPGYDAVCSFNWVVIHPKWLDAILAALPAHWGILLAEEEGINAYRPAKRNVNQKIRDVLSVIWKAELLALLTRHKQRVKTGARKGAMTNPAKKIGIQIILSELPQILVNRANHRTQHFRSGSLVGGKDTGGASFT